MKETRQYILTADKEVLDKLEKVFNEFIPKEESKPLFITEDGVPVEEGYPLHWLIFNGCKKQWDYQSGPSLHKNHVDPNIPGCLLNKPIYRGFSTKEAAVKWAEENKPKPLYVTEDGKELWKKEDWVYSVCPKGTWEKLDTLTAGYLAGIGRGGVHGRPYSNWKHFSSQEAADQYVLENKPQYSIKQIREAMQQNIIAGCPHREALHINGSTTLQTLQNTQQ